MRAVVVYESMYGNTHLVADAIGDGLRAYADAVVVPVDQADAALASGADLLVVGGPTHIHGISSVRTRQAAIEAAGKPQSGLTVELTARGLGVHDWLGSVGDLEMQATSFDTRLNAPSWFTGRASKKIARLLQRHGCSLVADPESFLVTKVNRLEPDEEARARRWGAILGTPLGPTTPRASADRVLGRRAR